MNQTGTPIPNHSNPAGNGQEVYLLPKKRSMMTRVLLSTFVVILAAAIIVSRTGGFGTMSSGRTGLMTLSGLVGYLADQLSIIARLAVVGIVLCDVILFAVRKLRRRGYYRSRRFDRPDRHDPC